MTATRAENVMPDFIPDLSVILAFALAGFVLAITPGPDMALFVSRTMNYGRTHGFATVLGALTGIAVHTMLVAFGISVLIVAAPTAFWVLKIAGALYLVLLAIQAIRDGGGLLVTRAAGRQPSFAQSYMTGLGINLTNPKVALFFVTFLPQFVSADDPAASSKLLFLGVEFVAVSLPIVIAIVLAAEWLTTTLRDSKWVSKALNWSFAAVFMAFAATILLAEGRK
jgi:threonine/homoserine/homoserine lactone efflux protein